MTMLVAALLVGIVGAMGGHYALKRRKNKYVQISMQTLKHRMDTSN